MERKYPSQKSGAEEVRELAWARRVVTAFEERADGTVLFRNRNILYVRVLKVSHIARLALNITLF